MILISTDHVSRKALDAMGERTDGIVGPDVYADSYKYGWHLTIVPMPEEEDDEAWLDPSIRAVVEYALANRATHLRLDVDGPMVDSLTIYQDA